MLWLYIIDLCMQPARHTHTCCLNKGAQSDCTCSQGCLFECRTMYLEKKGHQKLVAICLSQTKDTKS